MGYMVSCWWDSLAHAAAVSLVWEKVEGSWNCESGSGFGKVDMSIFGDSCEGWVGVDV